MATQTLSGMEGWMAQRAMRTTVECKAIRDAGGRPDDLGADKGARTRFARALQQGAAALAGEGVDGRPWMERMRTAGPFSGIRMTAELKGPAADLIFGVRARRIGAELDYLVDWALGVCEASSADTSSLEELLRA